MSSCRLPNPLWAASFMSLLLPVLHTEVAISEEVPVAPGVQRERVNLVLIDVVVTDRKGRHVDDLRPEEFSLRVDGHPHAIESVELQWSGGAPETISRPVSEIQPRAAPATISAAPFNRHFVFLLDGVNSERGLGLAPIQAVRQFLQKGLPPRDEVMIAGLGRDLKIYQEFTADRGKMLAAMDTVESDPAIRNIGENRVHQNIIQLEEAKENCVRCGTVDQEQAAQRIGVTFADEDRRRSVRTLASLRALVAYLHSGSGRKELFFLTDGFSSDPSAFYGTPDERSRGAHDASRLSVAEGARLEQDILHLAREAAAAQVVIHTINTQGIPRGVATELRKQAGRPWETLIESEASDTLAVFALGTGGVASHGNNNFEAALERVEQETRASYLVAYVPSGKPDGKYHATKVEVTRKGVRVRAKEGFLWMTDEEIQERQLLAAHLSPELFHDFPLALEARSYLGAGGRPAVEVALAVPDQSLLFLPQGGQYSARLEAGMVLRAGKSQIVDQFSRTVEVQLSAQDFAAHGSLTLLARREIPPGEYDAVAVVRDLGTGNIGALRSAVKIPTLAPGRLAMSTLLLESEASKGRRVDIDPSTKGDQDLVVPAVIRVFPRNARVVGSCLIYHPAREAATGEARVRVRSSIRKGSLTVQELADSLHTFRREERIGAVPLEFPLPLSDLTAGIYSLSIQALDEVDRRGVTQSVEFMVR